MGAPKSSSLNNLAILTNILRISYPFTVTYVGGSTAIATELTKHAAFNHDNIANVVLRNDIQEDLANTINVNAFA